ncbi:MAG TPA: BamA/TamA family outer membrane protein, partial [Bacteroidia bacterium]|nr:BamA/TamA family outer membrane protein [Bacteroidia bacterium]
VKLKLQNSFGQGELIDVNWRQPFPKTQDLKLRFNYPFLISYFGSDLRLNLYKKDSTYLEVARSVAVDYLMSARQSIRGTYLYKTSSLITVKQYANATVLPANADFKLSRYILSYENEKLDYRLNPRKGYHYSIDAGAGNRTLIRNSGLAEELYDSLDLKQVQFAGSAQIAFYLPIALRSALKLAVQSEWIEGDRLFENELIRFGGLQTLRGFDEEALLASVYIMPLLEYRFIIDENSYLALFTNMAWYERKSSTYINDTPYGFGAGINFETKLGIFSFNYALGSQFNNGIDLRNGKIHFGLVNYF